uniref:Short-chain dehydrogenase n=1 Tax=Batrachochytrium dendrobatidis (strain JAM81 / FGSC 10211) TaxID=684364 RepID=F4PF53_BATDJ|eukprot:XP_006683234.1 hypothetical protein BATDEDRAFT_28789 [Batrachochytrium dendrobatidis JAM81]
MKHALIVGRTDSVRMEKLIEKAGFESHITPILVNYTNNNELQEKVRHTIKQNGSIDIVVAWIHSNAEEALPIIVEEVSKQRNEWDLFHVLGSSSNLETIKRKTRVPKNCVYHQMQLGFVIKGVHSRWLTHQEISNGVMEAIEARKQVFTVGVVEPWEKRP